MNDYDRKWQQLAAAVRSTRDDREDSAPYGFATRVAGLAMTAPLAGPWALFEKFAVRGLIAACAFSVAAVAFGYTAFTSERENDVASYDAVSEVLDLGS
jgi:hypothetical protein